VRLALRTQQIIAHESGVPNTVDPLGGSYFVETLTNEMENACVDYFNRIDAMGGMIEAIELGFPQREIQEASYQFSRALERKEKSIVGVNEFEAEDEKPVEILKIDERVAERQCAKLEHLRSTRDGARVRDHLSALKRAAQDSANLMPFVLECVRSYATLGEMCDTLRSVFGEYQEPAIY
jgi:methylmalonyl-CoA mutase N-terminal domain/subunit